MIVTRALHKNYGDLAAVNDISFRVGEGEVLGFLGPNGAGKSTTMKMIAGFLKPSSGSVEVCGHDTLADPMACKRLIGYLPEGAPSYEEMTPRSFLDFVSNIRGLSGANRRARLEDVIGRLHLGPVLDQTIETLSKGFKRRVGLAQAILHDPKVLILDEPTDGLDPNQKHEVHELIASIAADKIIIISTHILEEVHAVCSRAIIIAKGRMLADDTPAALAARSEHHNAVRMTLTSQENFEAARDALRHIPGVARLETAPESMSVTALAEHGKSIFHAVGELVTHNGWDVARLEVDSGRLDEVFRQITLGDGGQAHG